jgi:hypothetical protein
LIVYAEATGVQSIIQKFTLSGVGQYNCNLNLKLIPGETMWGKISVITNVDTSDKCFARLTVVEKKITSVVPT